MRGKTLLRAMIIKFISKQLPVRDARKGMIYECVLECVGDMGGGAGGMGQIELKLATFNALLTLVLRCNLSSNNGLEFGPINHQNLRANIK